MKNMAMIVLTYKVRVCYAYSEDHLPNVSMLTQRTLRENLIAVVKEANNEGTLDTVEVHSRWVEVEQMTSSGKIE